MNDVNLIIRSRRIVTPEGVRDALVVVREGRIAAIEPVGSTGEHGLDPVDVDLGDVWLLPGLVDSHVHINEPGRTEWEGFETATRAAAAGGVTTVVDMPLNCIPATTTFDAYQAKARAARGKLHVDAGFWGGVVPGNTHELESLAECGALGFKCFMVDSGVGEFAHVGEADLREAMPVIARLGLPLLAHAELPGPIEAAVRAGSEPRRYATWLDGRPAAAEVEAIRMLIRLCEATGCRVHVVHLCAIEALDDLRAARARGLPITVETCPHYLYFAAEDIADGATDLKCAPPIRSRANRDGLRGALVAGDIDLVATDHSPCLPDLKCMDSGDCMKAWGGIASLELGLSVVWTCMRRAGVGSEHLARWMSGAPARLAGLEHRKGTIAAGHDADLIAWDPDAAWRVDAARLHQRHALTPYHGAELHGRVLATFVRGRKVFDGSIVDPPIGRLVTRS